MTKTFKILIGLGIFLSIIIVYYGSYLNENKEAVKRQKEIDHDNMFSKGDYDFTLQSNISDFTLLATKFSKENIITFCSDGTNQYIVNGDVYDLKNNEYFESHTMGGYHRGFNELLVFDHLNLENFYYYKNFLDKYDFISCIKNDLNLKANKNFLPLYAIKFNVTNQSGYIYISDGSVFNNVNEKYKNNASIIKNLNEPIHSFRV